MGGCINIFKFFQSELSFDDLFHFWQEFPALDLQIWVQLIGLCASCCSIPACASVSDSAGRKYSTSNSGKARFSWPFFLRTQHHYTSKGIQVMSWNKSCVLLKGRGLCHWKKEKKNNQQKNLMHSFSRAVIAHLPFQCCALSWLKLKAQIGAALKTFLRNIFH